MSIIINPLLITTRSWILIIHMTDFSRKKNSLKTKKGSWKTTTVTNIGTMGYNGTHMNCPNWPCSKQFDSVQKILDKGKNFWTWLKYFWTSRWNRQQLVSDLRAIDDYIFLNFCTLKAAISWQPIIKLNSQNDKFWLWSR